MNALGILLLIILMAIAIIILLTNKLHIHPFLALILSSLFVGFASGIDASKVIELITSGFGGILSGIGIIVVLGTVMGVFVERSGALNVIASHIIRLFGSKNLLGAVSFLGAVVSIPVFCDSGFIILSKLVQRLAKLNQSNSIPLSLSLAAGLYTTHTLIPPTPGPLAVAGNLTISDQLGVVILAGILVSIPVLIVSAVASARLGKSMTSEAKLDLVEEEERPSQNQSLLWAVVPILSPILLISMASMIKLANVSWAIANVLLFVGNPNIALLIGCCLAMMQIKSVTKKEVGELFKEGVSQAGPIILITGAGGAFGSVLKGTDLAGLLSDTLGEALVSFPILVMVSFGLAALLKTAQGSSTSALVIASAIIAPIALNLPSITSFQMALLVMSFGAGAMTVSHANDSYFWVVTQFSGMTLKQGYRGFSILTLFQGVTALLTVLVLYFLSMLL